MTNPKPKHKIPFEKALVLLLDDYRDIDPAERADELDRQIEGLRDEAANK